jgi:Flp pilus assembly protein TadD
MCRKLWLAATALMLTPALLVAAPAHAFSFGKPAAAPAQASAKPGDPPSQASAPKASAQERETAERMDPLSRAAFWASQVSADPKEATAGIRLAAALRAIGRFQEAYDAAQAVLVLEPNNVEALLETARVALADNQGFFAIEPARKAMALAPRDWRAPSLLAVGCDQAGRPAEALAAHKQAMAVAPNNPLVLSNAAMFYAGQGDKAQAEVLLRQAAALPGATVKVRQNLALVLGLEGKLAEAEALQREDLPPQMADNNLAYMRAATAVPVVK